MRFSSAFRPLGDELWCVDCEVWDKGLHITLRMPVIRLSEGLLLYSPVPFDAAVEAQILALGDVTHIVAPNLNHHLFVEPTAARFGSATLHGPPGIEKKRRDSPWQQLPDLRDHVVPIRLGGVPFSRELVLVHRASNALICADLVQNVHREESFVTRQLHRAMGNWQQLGSNRWWKYNTKDHGAFRGSLEQVLAHHPERIVMSHGDVVERDGAAVLREAMSWVAP